MSRRLVVLGVVALWLAGVGFFVKREYFKPRAEVLAEAAAAKVGPSAAYYTLSMGGQPVGYISATTDTLADTIKVQSNWVLGMQALGSVQQVGIVSVINLSRAMRLRSFDAQVNSAASRFQIRGRAVADSTLEMTIDAGGHTQHIRTTLGRSLVMSDLVNRRLALGGRLVPGRTYTMRVFDPITQRDGESELTVLAESTMTFADSARFDSTTMRWVPAHHDTTRAYRISQTYAGSTAESWIDGQGNILTAGTPLGITLQRTAFEIAVENWRKDKDAGRAVGIGSNTDVITNTAIASNVPLQPSNLVQLKVRLGNVTLEGFDLSGGRQQLAGDTLVVTREASDAHDASHRLTMFDAKLPFSGVDSALTANLRPEPLIQSDDPRIVAQARAIVGQEQRAGPVAQLLNDWVYHTLKKEITISVPSATQVLDEKSGDCNEHTVLYVALARAVGLPARTAAGVMYVPRLHSFFYHAWPEVWLGQWVAVDPTWGQFPADASHLRFTIGGLARQVELIRLIGRLRLTVVGTTS